MSDSLEGIREALTSNDGEAVYDQLERIGDNIEMLVKLIYVWMDSNGLADKYLKEMCRYHGLFDDESVRIAERRKP